MPRPLHFEIHTSDPEAAQRFYGPLFGWRFERWHPDVPYWTIRTGDGDPETGRPDSEPGIDGGLVMRTGAEPTPDAAITAWVCTVGVPDCQAYVDRAVAAGATVAFPMAPVPGIGWLAYLKDPDGNMFGMLSEDADAPIPT